MKEETIYDYLIIGAGPAGLQLGYFFEKQKRDYIIVEKDEMPGGYFKKFPRHDMLLSINKSYTGFEEPEINLRWDWNALLCDEGMPFKAYSKAYFPSRRELVHYLEDFASRFQLNIRYSVTISTITKDRVFRLYDSQGHIYQCRRLIIATGVSQPYIPTIPGIEHVELYTDVSIDPDDFAGQRVLILGKGNSAFETAENLIGTAALIHLASPSPITMAWKSHFVGHLRAINNSLLDTYHLKSQNAILDATIEQIERQSDCYTVSVSYTHAAGEKERLLYDRVIACTGFRFDASIFDATCRPRLAIDNRLPEQTSEWESTNVQDLYFAGTLMQMRDYKKTASAFIHGFRYNIRALDRIFACKYHGQPWPCQRIDKDAKALTDYVITRVNTSSALWQQFGYLCDLIVIPEEEQYAYGYEDIPIDYVHDTLLGQHRCFYIVTLEYGESLVDADPFNIQRTHRHDSDHAHQSRFLHPIIRRFDGDQLLSEHHIIEDLYGIWLEDCHINPTRDYFKKELSCIEDHNIIMVI